MIRNSDTPLIRNSNSRLNFGQLYPELSIKKLTINQHNSVTPLELTFRKRLRTCTFETNSSINPREEKKYESNYCINPCKEREKRRGSHENSFALAISRLSRWKTETEKSFHQSKIKTDRNHRDQTRSPHFVNRFKPQMLKIEVLQLLPMFLTRQRTE